MAKNLGEGETFRGQRRRKETEDVYKYCVPLSNVSMDNYSTYYGLLRPEYKIYGV
jgi:hypothetical protein